MKMISYLHDFINLLYPRLCMACGSSLFRNEEILCTHCLLDLPRTNFHRQPESPIDRIFWGRVPVERTAALYLFSKGGKVQHFIHQLKYKGQKEVGVFAGKLLGNDLKSEPWFHDIERIIPVPLHPNKFRKRGYNQSEQFAVGISESTDIPVDTLSFIRTIASETQTRKSRFARFENVKEIFHVTQPAELEHKHLLLVDDVITTGSTLEACVTVLLQVPGVRVSVAAIAYAEG